MKFSKLLQALLFGLHLNSYIDDPAGGGGGDDEAAQAAAKAKEEADAAAAAKAKEEADAEAARKANAGNKPTDAEAKLIKEVMQKKDALAKASADLAAVNARLKEFDGLDPAELRELAASKKKAEEDKALARGEFEAVRTRMAQEHTTATKTLKDQIEALTAQLATAAGTIDELTVGAAFNQSSFVPDSTVYTPAKARVIYGTHFDLVDGEVVAYDKPRGAANRAPLVDQFNNNLKFDDAMQKIVEMDPEKDKILKSKVKPGAGSGSKQNAATKTTAVPTDAISKISAGLKGLKLS